MSNENFVSPIIKTIRSRVLSKVPVNYITTPEEVRVMTNIIKGFEALDKEDGFDPRKYYVWSLTRGLREITKDDLRETKVEKDRTWERALAVGFNKFDEDTQPAIKAMEKVRTLNRAVLFFNDIDQILQNDIQTQRGLRELAFFLRRSDSCAILIAPNLVVPPSLRSDISVIDYPFPDTAETEYIVDDVIANLKKNQNTIVLKNGEKESVIRALSGLPEEIMRTKLRESYINFRSFDPSFIIKAKEEEIKKMAHQALEFYDTTNLDLNSIGGLDLLKTSILRMKRAFSIDARKHGIPAPRGILLFGQSGCGKSLSAKAIATSVGLPLLRLNYAALLGGIVGESESNQRIAFKTIRAVSPVVVLLDEMEKAVGEGGELDGGTSKRLLGEQLTFMQECTDPVFWAATANDIQSIERKFPELLRRFDDIWFIDLPNANELREIWDIQLRKYKCDPKKFDLDELVKYSKEFSGSEVEKRICEALRRYYADGKPELGQDDLVKSLREFRPLSVTARDKIEFNRKYASEKARNASSKIDEILDFVSVEVPKNKKDGIKIKVEGDDDL